MLEFGVDPKIYPPFCRLCLPRDYTSRKKDMKKIWERNAFMKDGNGKTLKTILNQEIHLKDLIPFLKKSSLRVQADGSKPQNLSDFSVSMTPDEIRNFVLMSQSGLSFRQAAVISFRNADEIFDLLKQGIPLEKVFTYNQKKKFFRQLESC